VHLFGNGGYQKLYVGARRSTQHVGTGYGGRVEIGPVHLGGGGHSAGVGLTYAFDGSATSSSQHDPIASAALVQRHRRDGAARRRQFDINLGFGRTQVARTDQDNATTDASSSPNRHFRGVVYHLNESFHLDVDFINTSSNGRAAKAEGQLPERRRGGHVLRITA